MRRVSGAAIALGLAGTAWAADSVDVQARQVSPDRFELTAQFPASLDPQQASSMLQPVADQLCAGRGAKLGHYSFQAIQSLGKAGDAPPADGTPTQTFIQQVECGGATPLASGVPAPKAPPTPEDERTVREATLGYLEAKDRGDFDAAHTLLGEEAAALMRADNWRTPRAAFNADAGLPSRREVVRLTWYDDPAGAPRSGRYVAADYRGDYTHAGFYCGFVVWYREADGRYRIVREEEGQIPAQAAKKLAPEALAAARVQVGCRD